jgi:hypothetical protein
MTPGLLGEFLALECDTGIRQMLLAEIGKHGAVKADVVREFNFNVFDVRLDFLAGSVTIYDVLDAKRECVVTLPEFMAALNEAQSSTLKATKC